MRLMVVSDIHGSLSACESSLNRFFEEKADKLLILGDILYHGPRNSLPGDYNPKEVARRLNEYKDRILCVRGNCDTEPFVVVYSIVAVLPVLGRRCGFAVLINIFP